MLGQPHPQRSKADQSDSPQANRGPQVYRFKFHGTTSQFMAIVLKNAVLTVLTLGLYTFAAKVKLRQFMHHSSEFHGQRFSYHGTWQELRNGYLKVALFVIIYSLLSQAQKLLNPKLLILTTILNSALFLLVIGFATYSGRRYLLSRTSWRGIYFAMNPSSKIFVKEFFIGSILSILTLGLYSPYFQNRKHTLLMKSTRFGSMRFTYNGTDKDAARIFFKHLPLMIFTLGLSYPWYRAQISRFRAHHTWIGSETLGAARGCLSVTGSEIFKLYAFNALILIPTFGFGAFWLVSYNMSYYFNRFSLVGELNFKNTMQVASTGSAAGASLASLAGLSLEL